MTTLANSGIRSPAFHTKSPEILAGYVKNTKARAVSAGFKMFIPVPPNTSLPMTTPKVIPSATCHKGIVAGSVSGKEHPSHQKAFVDFMFPYDRKEDFPNPANDKGRRDNGKDME